MDQLHFFVTYPVGSLEVLHESVCLFFWHSFSFPHPHPLWSVLWVPFQIVLPVKLPSLGEGVLCLCWHWKTSFVNFYRKYMEKACTEGGSEIPWASSVWKVVRNCGVCDGFCASLSLSRCLRTVSLVKPCDHLCFTSNLRAWFSHPCRQKWTVTWAIHYRLVLSAKLCVTFFFFPPIVLPIQNNRGCDSAVLSLQSFVWHLGMAS